MKLGFLYAGQGSQHPGMGADLYEAYPAFRAVYDSSTVDFDLKKVSFEDPDGVLNQTRYTQPCMVAFAAGMTAVLKDYGIEPCVAAGLSLGEYSALHAAGVLDAQTAVSVAAFRGAAMEKAAEGIESAMMAVLGAERTALQEACQEASALGTVVIANYNCPGQMVIGGEKAAVTKAAGLAKEKGAKRCLPFGIAVAKQGLDEIIFQPSIEIHLVPILFVPMPGAFYLGMHFPEFEGVIGITFHRNPLRALQVETGENLSHNPKRQSGFIKRKILSNEGE